MEFEICSLEIDNVIYFSEDGINFSRRNSTTLYPYRINKVYTHPHNFFLLESDLMDGKEPVGDGEITASQSDWHEKVFLDGQVFYVPGAMMFRRVIDYLKKTGEEYQ